MISVDRIVFVFIVIVIAVTAFAQDINGEDVLLQASTNRIKVPAAPENGGPRNWEVTGVSRALNLRE